MKDFDDLIREIEEPEKEKFTIEELEEKLGKLLRIIEGLRIKEDAWQIRFLELTYRLNKMFWQKCRVEEMLNYFNLKKDKIFCEIDFLD